MAISYSPLMGILEKGGYSLNKLVELGVISDYASRLIRANKPVNLIQIESICDYFDVPIEQVVHITKD